MKRLAFFIFTALLSTSSVAANDCSIWNLGDRLASSVTPAARDAFTLLGKAFEDPELMHSPAFRKRLARKMEEAGYDGKRYLAPPSESGPFPSKSTVMGWVDDASGIVSCR